MGNDLYDFGAGTDSEEEKKRQAAMAGGPMAAAGAALNSAPASGAAPSLYESMQRRMAAVQAGQADPGNADLYGYNQTAPGAAPAAGAPASAPYPLGPQAYDPATGTAGHVPPAVSPGMDANNPAGDPILRQAAGASTESATPGAAPSAATANQGTQDVVRNSWIKQATQSTAVDPNDPNIKQQVDPFAAQQERSRRDYESQAAERLSAKGLGDSGQMQNERRFGAERAGQATGMFQSQLIGDELKTKRQEIQDALSHLGDTISGDQKNALTQKLADLDATIKREGISSGERIAGQEDATKREGIASGERVGNREIDVKDRLGTGANNNDLIKAMLQNQQNNDGQSFNWANFDWETSPMNPKNR